MSIFELLALYFTAATAIFIEGETALITAALASKIGYLNYPLVLLTGFIATLAYDWTFFFTGRLKGRKIIENKQGLNRFKQRIDKLLNRFPVIFLLGYRFIYGFRGAICLIIGLSQVSTKKFILLSSATTLIWATIYSGLGYFFGKILEKKLNDIQKSGPLVIVLLIVTGIILTLIFAYYTRKRFRK